MHHGKFGPPMSALGQKRTLVERVRMTAPTRCGAGRGASFDLNRVAPMTVAWVEKAGQQYSEDVTHCTWFIQDKEPWKIDERTFPLTMLKLLQP